MSTTLKNGYGTARGYFDAAFERVTSADKFYSLMREQFESNGLDYPTREVARDVWRDAKTAASWSDYLTMHDQDDPIMRRIWGDQPWQGNYAYNAKIGYKWFNSETGESGTGYMWAGGDNALSMTNIAERLEGSFYEQSGVEGTEVTSYRVTQLIHKEGASWGYEYEPESFEPRQA